MTGLFRAYTMAVFIRNEKRAYLQLYIVKQYNLIADITKNCISELLNAAYNRQ